MGTPTIQTTKTTTTTELTTTNEFGSTLETTEYYPTEATLCGTNVCEPHEICCPNVTCVQQCLGQAPSSDQLQCEYRSNCARVENCICDNGAVVPDLGALPIIKCERGLICKQGAPCAVDWEGERVCGSVGTVVLECLKHKMAGPVEMCQAEEKGCTCS